MKILKSLLFALCVFCAMPDAGACSRVVYQGDSGLVLVGRTLDWRTSIPTNLYVYPRGVARQSMPSGPRLQWTSRYASVLAVGYDGGVTEGMNERGLVMNGLFCKGTIYRTADSDSTSAVPVVSLAMFVSWFLDNFATVAEVDDWLRTADFAVYGQSFDGGTASTLHWAVTDATGDNLLIEYTAGIMRTYRGRDLTVLTNDPPHPQMEAIEAYWRTIGGTNMLPGTVRSADRYVRASYFIGHVPKGYAFPEAFASLSGIMGVVSVPFGYELPGEPNVSSTQWTSVSDATSKCYWFRQATAISYLYIDLEGLSLSKGSPILKLDMARYGNSTSGCANALMVVSPGFTPMW